MDIGESSEDEMDAWNFMDETEEASLLRGSPASPRDQDQIHIVARE